jgi:hypothetical protein
MQSEIEEGCQNLIDGVTLQLQKEKEYKIKEGQQKIHEEVEIHLEDVHSKYDGIISKARVIKDQANVIDDDIVFEKKIDEMSGQNEGIPSNVKPYRHPHYQEKYQDKKDDINLMKEEDGILVNIHGTRDHKTTLQQVIIICNNPN